MAPTNQIIYFFFYNLYILCFSLSSFMASVKPSSIMWNKKNTAGQPCLVPNFTRKHSVFTIKNDVSRKGYFVVVGWLVGWLVCSYFFYQIKEVNLCSYFIFCIEFMLDFVKCFL